MEGYRQCSIDLMTPHTLIEPYPLRTTAPQQFELLLNVRLGGNGVWMLCGDGKGVLVLISAFLYEYDMLFIVIQPATSCSSDDRKKWIFTWRALLKASKDSGII